MAGWKRGVRGAALAWRAAAGVVGVVLLAAVVNVPLGLEAQALFGGAVFAASLVAFRSRSPFVTVALAAASIAVSARYVRWRLTTIGSADASVETALGALLLAAEAYAFLTLVLGYVQTAGSLRRRPEPLPDDATLWPTLDVYVPTYNEPLEVVRATVLAARGMDWPREKLRIWILDDGRRAAFRAFAARAGVGYLTRPDNAHAKAGNINAALARTRGEFVAIFDCDQVPTRSFLQMTMGWFLRDPKLAFVQTPHHFYSPDPFERNLRTFRRVPNEGELFYALIQPGNDLWNAAFFCGSCAVLRRSALADVGGIAVETVTEDAHTAVRMHRRGWHSAYLDLPQAGGLATESLSAHVGQRIRWARGMAQIFRVDNPLLGRGLTVPQRLCYLAAMLHFFSGVPRLVFLVAPLWYLFFELHVFNALPLAALAYALPHISHATATNSRIQGRFRHSFWSEVYETCLAFYIAVPTTVALLDPKAGSFNVTAKGGKVDRSYFDWRIAQPMLVLAALQVAGIAAGAWRLSAGRGRVDAIVVNMVWSVHSLVIVAATLAVAYEQRQVRAAPRVAAKLAAIVQLASGHTIAAQSLDLSRSGARLAASTERPLAAGERVWVSFIGMGDELPVPAEVVAREDGQLRVKWGALALEEELAVVAAVFGRADAWTRWRDGRGEDHPVRSLREVAAHGLAGVWRVGAALSPFPGRRTVALPAMARSTT
ncbi:MAG: UDP-forming cellulose synthase catalytic subunit [Anaeromyxobacteraceae bacterium]